MRPAAQVRRLPAGLNLSRVNPEPDEETGELRRKQAARRSDEGERAETAEHEAERDQHSRRADKAAYLEEKLAERERAEREAD